MKSEMLRWLGIALALQVALAAITWWPAAKPEGNLGALLGESTGAPDSISFSDGERRIELLKAGERWLLGGPDGLPADSARVTALLDTLTNLQGGWPVASSVASHARLGVGATQFQRRIELQAAEARQALLLLGTAAGLRATHVRVPPSDTVYAAAISTVDLPLSPSDWLDKRLLAVSSISAIEHAGYRYEQPAGDWTWSASGTPATAPLTPPQLGALAEQLRNLQVIGVAGGIPVGEPEPDLVLTVAGPAGPVSLSFSAVGEEYFVQRSDYTAYFRLSAATYRELLAAISAPAAGEPEATDVHQSEAA